jgi:hypothetical protein
MRRHASTWAARDGLETLTSPEPRGLKTSKAVAPDRIMGETRRRGRGLESRHVWKRTAQVTWETSYLHLGTGATEAR